MHKPLLCAWILWAFASGADAADGNLSVTVEAGQYDRRGTVVTFPLTVLGERPNVVYQGARRRPLQFPPGASHATFVLLELPAGRTNTFRLAHEPTFRSPDAFEITRKQTTVEVRPTLGSQGMPAPGPHNTNFLFAYQAEPAPLRADIRELFRRGGYLHPIRTRSGRTITDDFPPNHIHHHGIWWAWTETRFQDRKPDFWNMGQGRGRVEFVALDSQWSGPVHGGFTARHRFVDLTGEQPLPALDETWEVTTYDAWADDGKAWFFDLTSSQHCATADPLKLPKYHYGGIGLRGNWAWNGAANAKFLTSNGETNRVKAHEQRARWCDMSGLIDGVPAGIAVLCHPGNFRAPQPMRVHPNEPFFCYAPQQLGDMEIKPGESYVSRYRFVVHDGPPDRAELDRLWNDYAHPPVARVNDR